MSTIMQKLGKLQTRSYHPFPKLKIQKTIAAKRTTNTNRPHVGINSSTLKLSSTRRNCRRQTKTIATRQRGRAHCWVVEAMATTEEKALLPLLRQFDGDGAGNAMQEERDGAIRDMATFSLRLLLDWTAADPFLEFCWGRGVSECCVWCARGEFPCLCLRETIEC